MSLCRFPQIAAREITLVISRRSFLGAAAATALVIAEGVPASAAALSGKPNHYNVNEKLTPKAAVTTYNNFYEFGVDTADPAHPYACRPPGVFHGPFRSAMGCLLLEIHYIMRRH
ncbi:hypothetical protein [Rhizobium ruizarguesonis]|uniref:Twin-arginine translocation signal domain-containing protein n=1 Tax=Rhizobium ruizarguesonis TaxID=2081791 RepID=A0AB38I2B5_9HYPH|nr:hypothetical protein [Rhizobium ruizarguesonis]NKK61726.1 hypothetical protein [Rhizobium leguminosarum bv. viciae]TBC14914.1 hypothetical protein ELH40_08185 [Rhizobium ruizarguesonis]